jgi:hypothetical protein
MEGLKRLMEGVNSIMTNLIHCKNLSKCHNVLPPSTTIKEKKKKKVGEPSVSMGPEYEDSTNLG